MTTRAITHRWRSAIRDRFAIQPTFLAMQRHLLFALRSASVQSSEPSPGEFRTDVRLDGNTWMGEGASPEEAMATALLKMTREDGTVVGATPSEGDSTEGIANGGMPSGRVGYQEAENQ